jgi:hypothetical protein
VARIGIFLLIVTLFSLACSLAVAAPVDYAVWAADGMAKVAHNAAPAPGAARVIKMWAARNEYESAQVVVRAGTQPLDQVKVTIADLIGPKGAKISAKHISLYKVAYVPLRDYGHDQADPLLPYMPFAVAKDTNQPVWITINVPKGTPAGEYNSEVTIQPAQAAKQTVPLTLTVWNFTLPETPASKSAFGIDYKGFATDWGIDPNNAAYDKAAYTYYETMLAYRISPIQQPFPLSDPRSKRYLDDKRLTSFVMPYSEDVAQLKKDVEFARTRGWLDKGYYYVVDEPVGPENYDAIKRVADKLHSVDKSLKLISPFYMNPYFDPGRTIYQVLDGYLNIWCPITSYVDYDKGFLPAMKAQKEKGNEVWWYICWNPPPPFINYYISEDGIDPRMLSWMQKLYDVQGLLYWDVNYWISDPWTDPARAGGALAVYGDGYVFYPGKKLGIKEPIGTIRLECIRDGMEDFDYLTLLEKKIGADKTKELIRQVATDTKTFDNNPEKLQRMRREIGEKLQN